MNMIE